MRGLARCSVTGARTQTAAPDISAGEGMPAVGKHARNARAPWSGGMCGPRRGKPSRDLRSAKNRKNHLRFFSSGAGGGAHNPWRTVVGDDVRGACGALYEDVLARHGGETMFPRQAEKKLRGVQRVFTWQAEKPVRGVQPLRSWQAERPLRGVQPLPAREAETQLRGVHPLTPRQVEKKLHGVQRVSSRQAEILLRGVQPLPPRQAEKSLPDVHPALTVS